MRVLAIVNLRSGQADFGIYDYLRAIGRTEAEVVIRFLGSKRTLASLLEDAKEFDRVIAVGGDGTVSGVCYALRNTGVPILPYPAGTANLLALNLRLPSDPIALADLTFGGPICSLDMGELSCPTSENGCEPRGVDSPVARKQGFMIMAGAGFDASIMESAKELKANIGAASYLVGALQNLAPTRSKFTLTLDGEEIETKGIAVLVGNLTRIQFDISMTSKSNPQDGLFEIVVLRTRNAAELLPALGALVISRSVGIEPSKVPGLDVYQAKTISVQADPALPMQFDGEVIEGLTPLEVRVLPKAATLVVSEEFVATELAEKI